MATGDRGMAMGDGLVRMALLRWLVLLGCGGWFATTAQAAVAGTSSEAVASVATLVLDYREWEPGGDPYVSRALITADFMRLDFAEDNADFVLMDRRAGTIYSVQTEDGRILEIAARDGAVGEPPLPLTLEEHSEPDPQAPAVAGQQPLVTEYRVNGELCTTTVSVPGLLPEAVRAWREFATIMAAQRVTTLHNTPREFWQPCSLANDIYAPTRYLAHGLPIREQNRSGISRELRGFDADVPQPVSLFRLPKDFQRFHIGEPIGGQLQ